MWHYDRIRRSLSTAAVHDGHDGLVHYPDFRGVLHCLDAKTSEVYWVHDLAAAVWGSPLVADGRVHLGDVAGDVVVLQAGARLKVVGEMNMGSAVCGSAVPANGRS